MTPRAAHPSRFYYSRAAALLAVALLALTLSARSASASLPPIKHVFVIVLENESATTTFGPGAPAPYLAQTLPSEGVYVPNYYAVGHNSLDNYIAMISGQSPKPATEADCHGEYDEFKLTGFGADGQAEGEGCVYPSSVKTLPEQLEEEGDSWRGYMQSMPLACSHAALNTVDEEQGEGTLAEPLDTYATRHDPFMWFKSLTEPKHHCEEHVVNLEALPVDLKEASTTPDFSFITPDVCFDGHDSTCKNPAEPAGFAGINSFLKTWVPMITGSPAYKEGGLLIVTFDEGFDSDTSSCCGETTSGGGDIGAVMLSPYITPDSTSPGSYNHYSLLRSVEDIFSLPEHIGDAAEPGTTTFESGIFGLAKNPPPSVATGSASSVTQTSATLGANIATNGLQVTACSFQYGTTSSYGSTAACSPASVFGGSAPVSGSVSGLSPGTTYHFRVVGSSLGGTSDGSDQQFETLPTVGSAPGPVKPVSPTLICPSGHSVTLKLPTGKKRLSHVTVTANKHKVKVTGSKKQPKVLIALTGRSAATVTVVITGQQGKHHYRSVHHYKSCHLS